MEAGCKIRVFCLPCERQVPEVSLAKKPSWVVHIFSSYANSRFISGFCHSPFPLWNTLLMSNCIFCFATIYLKRTSLSSLLNWVFHREKKDILEAPCLPHLCPTKLLTMSHLSCPTATVSEWSDGSDWWLFQRMKEKPHSVSSPNSYSAVSTLLLDKSSTVQLNCCSVFSVAVWQCGIVAVQLKKFREFPQRRGLILSCSIFETTGQ